MADEQVLPTLPKTPFNGLGSKRAWAQANAPPPPSVSTSSDPAVFSSDDDPALEAYENTRRHKRRYVGTWYDQHLALSSDSAMGDHSSSPAVGSSPVVYRPFRRGKGGVRPQKREFRKLDSGVYMGGQDSTDTEGDIPSPYTPKYFASPALLRVSPRSRPQISEAETIARERIKECVENGNPMVELNDLGLDSVSAETIAPIADIEPIPVVLPGMYFRKTDPDIQVFLYNNNLKEFPLSLVNIEPLTVLTLRNNDLTEIPTCIGKLRNLKTLNLAQNKLKYLPSEILRLMGDEGKLEMLQTVSNPWWMAEKLSFQSVMEHAGPNPLIRTPVEFLDSNGRIYSRFRLPLSDDDLAESTSSLELEVEHPSELEMPKEVSYTEQDAKRLLNPKGARSLFEYALKTLTKLPEPELAEVDCWLEVDEGYPHGLRETLNLAADAHRSGGLTCSVCRRGMVVPLTRWVEFHRTSGATKLDRELLVPFLKIGCSWRCVPEVVVSGGEDCLPKSE
ncbi:hypothetical protein QBC40DRAFT_200051 [Triangularia verruculosa]|uniref:Uncharacterized protein n=1 Tax=Triangularia verruculosa TaxID=2587418 RepID=A0AAN6XJ71_9PEZI|nr:hypothetical protein QBC40DRAFT_200051 [Triangularia verruculosa]